MSSDKRPKLSTFGGRTDVADDLAVLTPLV